MQSFCAVRITFIIHTWGAAIGMSHVQLATSRRGHPDVLARCSAVAERDVCPTVAKDSTFLCCSTISIIPSLSDHTVVIQQKKLFLEKG